MRSVPFVVSLMPLALVGCASNSTAGLPSSDFSIAALAAHVGASSDSGWHEVDPVTLSTSSSQDWASRQRTSHSSSRHLTVMGGERWLDEDDWGSLDEPLA